MTHDFTWSKADTHCVWCGKPFGSDADTECEGVCLAGAWLDSTLVVPALASLRATVEAQDAVIRRYRDGWIAFHRADDTRAWKKDGYFPSVYEPMTEAEQVVVYGEVVRVDG